MKTKGTNGSEVHRLKTFEHVDEKLFNRLWKTCQPLIRKLSRNIDLRKYNVSQDVIQSYFEDKFLYVYNKYQDKYDENHLKYTLIHSLTQFRNKLLRAAYTEQAEFNDDMRSLDDLSVEKDWDIEDEDETAYKSELSQKLHKFMKEHLTDDEYLLFITQLNPPPFFEERIKESHGRISAYALIEFFELPKNMRSQEIISQMRADIQEALDLAARTLR